MQTAQSDRFAVGEKFPLYSSIYNDFFKKLEQFSELLPGFSSNGNIKRTAQQNTLPAALPAQELANK